MPFSTVAQAGEGWGNSRFLSFSKREIGQVVFRSIFDVKGKEGLFSKKSTVTRVHQHFNSRTLLLPAVSGKAWLGVVVSVTAYFCGSRRLELYLL